MSLPSLLFVTNPKNEEPEEDLFLADYLKGTFKITIADPNEAVHLLPHFQRCFMRNAWPSRLFVDAFTQMRKICEDRKIKMYNPWHRNDDIEDKRYLVELWRQGYPVIPTVSWKEDMNQLPKASHYFIKPIDGCSSEGVRRFSREALLARDVLGYVIQPEIDLVNEISLYFIDNRFEYAMVSAGKNKRWDLKEYEPTLEDLAWAKRFVDWNKMPYGLQRIDGCRTKNGKLLLMEVEGDEPILSLSDLSEKTRNRVLGDLKKSLVKNLC